MHSMLLQKALSSYTMGQTANIEIRPYASGYRLQEVPYNNGRNWLWLLMRDQKGTYGGLTAHYLQH